MTYNTPLVPNNDSIEFNSICTTSLSEAIKNKQENEKASFHTPGHKRSKRFLADRSYLDTDFTELPGLDELANPKGVLARLSQRAAKLWGAKQSFLSVNGASIPLMAAILACCSKPGSKILLPKNAHRSAIHALVISGSEPVWYESKWLSEWQTWGEADINSFTKLAETPGLTAAIIVSPNYAGIISPIAELSQICQKNNIYCIVDEAHGAHLRHSQEQENSLFNGADLLVHSLHKTLSAPTQTGLLHLNKNCDLQAELIQDCMNTLQSSSPNYSLLLGIEAALLDISLKDSLQESLKSSQILLDYLKSKNEFDCLNFESKKVDNFHILIKHKILSTTAFFELACQNGIYPETILGNALLFMYGIGSSEEETKILIDFLNTIEHKSKRSKELMGTNNTIVFYDSPPTFNLEMTPRQAFFGPSEIVSVEKAPGRISADCLAPCPPGYPLLIPGQLITEFECQFISPETIVRVVKT